MLRLLILFVCCLPPLWPENIKLFSGSSNPQLAAAVADGLGISLGKMFVGRFNDGEVRVQIQESVRNCDVFIIQSICPNEKSTVNDQLMELYLIIRAMKRASAQSITAVIPYFGYARQDRKTEKGVPISASDVAMMIESAGVDRVLAVDLHCGQIQGFFHQVPVDNLYASIIFVPYMAKQGLYNPVIVSPDAGGVERAKFFIEGLSRQGLPSKLAIIVKQRAEAGVVDQMNLIGDVAGCDAIIVDDICDTARTLVKAAKTLKEHGARRVFACISHPLLSGSACQIIAASPIEKLVVTDTIPLRCPNQPPNLDQITIAPLLSTAIRMIDSGDSLTDLFH